MKYLTKLPAILLTIFLGVSCEIGEQVDPNSPSLAFFETDAPSSALNNLVTGTLSQMRDQINVYYDEINILGREMYRFSGSDPRWHSDLLGGQLDDNAFYTTRVWGARYRAIKNANILISAATNSSVITDGERDGYLGFVKTILAHELLIVSNHQGDNGIRTEVTDPDNLGPFTASESASLNFIQGLLTEADVHLGSAGAAFYFTLPSGFTGFSDPATFRQFNASLAARVAAYQGTLSASDLTGTFLDPAAITAASFNAGVYMTFAAGGGDILNPMFLPLDNTGENRVAHPSFLTDLEVGDTRANKAVLRTAIADGGPGPVIVAGLTGTHDVFIYQSNTASVPVIRYEELVFLFVEASINSGNLAGAQAALNLVRNNYGLADYSGATTTAALTDEMLTQKRYSLWNEGHRWVDLRRFGRLDSDLPIDRLGTDTQPIHAQFPRPFDEVQAGG